MNYFVAAAHFLILVALFVWGLRPSKLSGIDKGLLVGLFFWADLAVAGYVMSAFSVLGSFVIFFLFTILCAAVIAFFSRQMCRAEMELAPPTPRPAAPVSALHRRLINFFLTTLALALLLNVAI